MNKSKTRKKIKIKKILGILYTTCIAAMVLSGSQLSGSWFLYLDLGLQININWEVWDKNVREIRNSSF